MVKPQTSDKRVHTSDIWMTYGVHTSDIRMTYEYTQMAYEWHDIQMTFE